MIGYATNSIIDTQDGPRFSPMTFCYDLVSFLGLSTRFSDRARYFGEYRLIMNILVQAEISQPTQFQGRIVTGPLFDPIPDGIKVNMGAETRITLRPTVAEPIRRAIASIANEMARAAGAVLSPTFDQFARICIDKTLETLARE